MLSKHLFNLRLDLQGAERETKVHKYVIIACQLKHLPPAYTLISTNNGIVKNRLWDVQFCAPPVDCELIYNTKLDFNSFSRKGVESSSLCSFTET